MAQVEEGNPESHLSLGFRFFQTHVLVFPGLFSQSVPTQTLDLTFACTWIPIFISLELNHPKRVPILAVFAHTSSASIPVVRTLSHHGVLESTGSKIRGL